MNIAEGEEKEWREIERGGETERERGETGRILSIYSEGVS
jgi:hypothetical protein